MEKKPRAHAELIKQWAEGAEIQYRQPRTGQWIDSPEPAWVFDWDYRVKPVRSYPETQMTGHALEDVYDAAPHVGIPIDAARSGFVAVANAALRHAIDNGQVVTREEFKRVSDEANKAVRSLNAYGYTDEGGDLWKPPLGTRHLFAEKRAERDLAVCIAVRDKCAGITAKHAMRSGVVNDIERLDLFAIIDAVNG